MAGVSREQSIKYGNLIIGGPGSGVFRLTKKIELTISYEESTVQFSVLVNGSTAAAFASAVRTLEAAFRTPYLDLTVNLSGSQILKLRQSDGSGLDAIPRIIKSQDEGDSGRLRSYDVVIEFGMPADNVLPLGLRTASFNVSEVQSSRRLVTISGTYTKVGLSDARAVFDANFDAFATAFLTTITGTFERTLLNASESSRNDTTLDFEAVFQEVIFTQGGASALDDPALKDQQFSIQLREDHSAGDSERNAAGFGGGRTVPADRQANVRRLTFADVNYSVWVDKDITQDLKGKAASIRDFILNQVEIAYSSGNFGILNETSALFPDENRIEITMTCAAAIDGQKEYSRTFTVTTKDETGILTEPAWDGDEFSRYVYPGPAAYIQTVREDYETSENISQAEARRRAKSNAETAATPASRGTSWILLSVEAGVTPVRLGNPNKAIRANRVSSTVIRERIKSIGRSTGGTTTAGSDAPGSGPKIAN